MKKRKLGTWSGSEIVGFPLRFHGSFLRVTELTLGGEKVKVEQLAVFPSMNTDEVFFAVVVKPTRHFGFKWFCVPGWWSSKDDRKFVVRATPPAGKSIVMNKYETFGFWVIKEISVLPKSIEEALDVFTNK